MTLRIKTLLIISSVVFLLTCVLLISFYFILSDHSHSLEEQSARLAINEALATLNNDIYDLSDQTSQLASDNNSKALLQKPTSSNLKKVFSNAIMEKKKINFALVLNKQGQIVYSIGYDRIKKMSTPLPSRLLEVITPQGLLLKHPHAKSFHSGVLTLPDKLLLIDSRPVVDDKSSNKINGTLILGQWLNYSEGSLFPQFHHMSVNIHRVDSKNPTGDLRAILKALSKDNPIIVKTLDNNLIAGYTLVNDIFGMPAFLVKTTLPRLIYQQGNLMFRLFIVTVITTLVFAMVLFLLLERFVLAKLVSISRQVRKIASTNYYAGRISVDGKDDLTAMGMAINYLLITFEQIAKNLKEAILRERRLAENMLDIVIQTDLKGIYEYISPSHKTILGHPSKKLLGKSFFDLIHPQDLKNVLEIFNKHIQKRTSAKFECRVHNSAGHYVWLEAFMTPLYDDNATLIGSIIAARDITFRKKNHEKA